ncbi:MAG: WbqC family protein [Tissierellia bacterium]|nr:WbqC family protein [Tissierellia bacterium]
MKVGIMQPYFFPYIGYWQLINAVDKYIIYDDVNYIKRGWVNRNRILVNGQARLINLKIHKASQNILINETKILIDPIYNKKLLKTIEHSYKKAPYYNEIFPIIERIILQEDENLARYLEFSIKEICKYLCIDTEIIISSSLNKNNHLKGQEKIIEICKILGADEYYNPIGGKELYSYEDFLNEGIKLNFLQTRTVNYKQFDNDFVPNLSIIDVMMFNSVDEIKKMLHDYEIL